jgi:hypothetical protein
MARRLTQLIGALALAAALGLAPLAIAAEPRAPDLRTPQTPWSALTPEQRRALGPVETDWPRMPGYQQQRLMGAARQYPRLQPIQKERFEERVRDWAAMTPEQRNAARETFQGLRKLPPEKQHELRERWLRSHGGEEGPRARPGRGNDEGPGRGERR